MKKILLSILLFTSLTFPQTYKEDSLAVQAILDSNNITNISVTDITSEGNGRIVYLSTGTISINYLPSEIGKLTGLQTLLFGTDRFESIPPEIGNLKNLEILYINLNDNLHSIPSEIGKLSNLKELHIAYNKNLTTLPEEIYTISSLVYFDLSYNNFSTLPDDMSGMTSLNTIYLNSNKFNIFPKGIITLPEINTLDLSYNQITTIPKEIGQIKTLGYFNLENNLLDTIPNEIMYLNISPWDINLCFNYSLSFSPEQQEWFGVKNYEQYHNDYCTLEIDKTPVLINKNVPLSLSIITNTINLYLPQDDNILLEIFNIKGIRIEIIANEYKLQGDHSFMWARKKYASAIYYIKLSTGNSSIIQKAFLVK